MSRAERTNVCSTECATCKMARRSVFAVMGAAENLGSRIHEMFAVLGKNTGSKSRTSTSTAEEQQKLILMVLRKRGGAS